METIHWVNKSRYGSSRSYTYNPACSRITIVCDDVMYVSYSQGKNPSTGEDCLLSVDPDGGPYLQRGGRLYPPSPYPTLRIVRIDKETYSHSDTSLIVVVTVEEVKEGGGRMGKE